VTLFRPAGAAAQASCDGRPIGSVRVSTRAVFQSDDTSLTGRARGLGNALHWRTKESTVRRALLFRPGDPCDLRRLRETERLLRAQPHFRDAWVTARPGPRGTEVLVETQDDWALRGSIRVEEDEIRRLRITEENLLGRGIRVQLRYTGVGREPGLELSGLHRQVFGRLDAELSFGTSGVGYVADQSLLRPFESEFDRVAWRESARYRKEPFPLVSGSLGTVAQPVVLFAGDGGAAWRFGEPGRLRLLGVALSGERLFVEGAPLAPDPAADSLAGAALAGRYTERRRLRVYALLGARALRFTQRTGMDAVNAAEDIREGLEAGLVLGRSLGGGGGLQRDWFAAVELFLGGPVAGSSLLFARGKLEGRRLRDLERWDGVLASGDLLLYQKIGGRGTMVLGLSGAGGWRTSAPFQLLLGGPGGIRGHGSSTLPAGRRVVAHAEHRYFAGTVLRTFDIGTALFVDAGRGWAGDASFGEDTGLLGAVGAGLRVAFPSGSRLTYRLDVAAPLGGRGRGLELRIGLRQQFGLVRGEPDDVSRSREQVSSVTLFNFPRF
jgi:hypothetical protein